MARVTMRDVAKLAEVSPTTVAHALNNNPDAQVAAKTRERVWAAARQLGYQRSLLQRSIKSSLRHIGIAVGRPGQEDDADTSALFEGIRCIAEEHGYVPVLQPMPTGIGQVDCSAAVNRIIELHRTKLIDGIVLDKQSFANVSVTEIHTGGVPIVTVNGSFEARTSAGEPVPGITYDSFAGGCLATEQLLELGHRRVALITRPLRKYPVAYRPMIIRRLLAGYEASLQAAGLTVDETLIGEARPGDRAAVEALVDQHLALPAPPTAWFVADDIIAVMVINALRRRGRRVPDDAAVIGYGDQPVANWLAEPPLTTVRTDLETNGRLAAELLIELLEGSERPSQRQRLLQPELVVRQSTAPPARQP